MGPSRRSANTNLRSQLNTNTSIALVVRVRQNATIDWNLKENVRARMKDMVKRLLRHYGYPPDMQALAIELVLEQAKVFTEFEVENSQINS